MFWVFGNTLTFIKKLIKSKISFCSIKEQFFCKTFGSGRFRLKIGFWGLVGGLVWYRVRSFQVEGESGWPRSLVNPSSVLEFPSYHFTHHVTGSSPTLHVQLEIQSLSVINEISANVSSKCVTHQCHQKRVVTKISPSKCWLSKRNMLMIWTEQIDAWPIVSNLEKSTVDTTLNSTRFHNCILGWGRCNNLIKDKHSSIFIQYNIIEI